MTAHNKMFALTLAALLCASQDAKALSHFARLEAGSVGTGYNYFQIPGDTGTRVNLPKGGSNLFFRLSGGFAISDQSLIRVLIAPLKVAYNLTPTANIEFNQQTFSANETTKVEYKFNSYRVSYIYHFKTDSTLKPRIGGTLKIRDAYIRVSQDGVSSTRSDLGLVPLLNLGAEWVIHDKWAFDFDLDGLASPQGRAFDGLIESKYSVAEKSKLGLGYRFVEGGADNNKVRNFALFNYWLASFVREF